MATLCKNCGHALIFNPASQKLECDACGSAFRPDEIEAQSRDYRQDLEAEAANEVYGTKDQNLMDCYVYLCSECGGEIIINGTEASTTCVYCGNPNVVFSRISKQKRPDYVMPFSITKDRAIAIVKHEMSKGIFIPKEIKNFSVDCCRGIYIPYWIVNAEYADTLVIKGRVKSGKNSVTKYYGRAGKLSLSKLPLDASRALSDESSSKLEPYNLSHLKPFDEDYLAGFYSNVSDVTFGEVRRATYNRAQDFYREAAMESVKGASSKTVHTSNATIKVDPDMSYAMLPAWFITFNYKGKHNTVLVNGDTGKVVCALPWKKTLFYALLIVTGIVITVLSFFIFKATLPFFFERRSSSSNNDSSGKLIGLLVMGIIALFTTGIRKVVRVIKNIRLTQDKAIFNFMKKRQG